MGFWIGFAAGVGACFVAGLAVGYAQQRKVDQQVKAWEDQGMVVSDRRDWSGARFVEARRPVSCPSDVDLSGPRHSERERFLGNRSEDAFGGHAAPDGWASDFAPGEPPEEPHAKVGGGLSSLRRHVESQ